MSLLISHEFLITSAILAALFNLLPVACIDKSSPEAMLMEDKTRLGSTPPSCHNRCNACNPCMAVQVPTLPAAMGGEAEPPAGDQQPMYSKDSNYKPLGWKCRCRNRLYNP